ncbi:MAG: F0F1 ATP synthase subunit alpha, partial [Pseudomonadales bacterium]|nr:F0F1 ATP synthase subunit alpha [Pseudomonadales bacterium]
HKVLDFESALVAYLNAEQADFMNEINESGAFSDEIEERMRKVIETFKSTQTW